MRPTNSLYCRGGVQMAEMKKKMDEDMEDSVQNYEKMLASKDEGTQKYLPFNCVS